MRGSAKPRTPGHGGRRALLVALALGLATVPQGALAQFSPGKLSRAHASIRGTTECFRCHEPRKATTAERCLACHVELGTRIAAGRGFHGRMEVEERQACGTCHAEHGGENASLVTWPGGARARFAHPKTGFVLAGKHAGLQCDQCHTAALVRAEDVRAAKDLDLARTHLGLSTRCADCHKDPHAGQFAGRVEKEDCAACHGSESWKKISFDHATARFPLTGKHAAASCEKCHFPVDASGARVAPGTAGASVRYRPLDCASCGACHPDPHQKRFGADCARCHTADGWKQIALAGFDHSKTRFALTGKHLQVECARCHHPENAAGQRVAAGTAGARPHYKPLAFAACTDCHPDPHQKRFGADCARCHSTAGWKTIAPGSFDHDQTRYALRGRHAQVACEKCHRDRKPSEPLAFAACTDCHAAAHGTQLARRADGGACEACHAVDGWSPARFGNAEHERTGFPLAGAHRAVACLVCHRPPQEGVPAAPGTRAMAANRLAAGAAAASSSRPALAAATSPARFRFASLACAGCHDDPHAGQFAVADAGPASGRAAAAAANGGPVASDGGPAASGGGGPVASPGTDCARCHATTSWRIAAFDHSKTRFPLLGAHKRTACTSCHRASKSGDRSIVRYKPLGTACRACHAEPQPPLGK